MHLPKHCRPARWPKCPPSLEKSSFVRVQVILKDFAKALRFENELNSTYMYILRVLGVRLDLCFEAGNLTYSLVGRY